MVAVEYCYSLLTCGVGTRVGLGKTESAELPSGKQVGQILHLLLFGTEFIDGSAAQGGVR